MTDVFAGKLGWLADPSTVGDRTPRSVARAAHALGVEALIVRIGGRAPYLDHLWLEALKGECESLGLRLLTSHRAAERPNEASPEGLLWSAELALIALGCHHAEGHVLDLGPAWEFGHNEATAAMYLDALRAHLPNCPFAVSAPPKIWDHAGYPTQAFGRSMPVLPLPGADEGEWLAWMATHKDVRDVRIGALVRVDGAEVPREAPPTDSVKWLSAPLTDEEKAAFAAADHVEDDDRKTET